MNKSTIEGTYKCKKCNCIYKIKPVKCIAHDEKMNPCNNKEFTIIINKKRIVKSKIREFIFGKKS